MPAGTPPGVGKKKPACHTSALRMEMDHEYRLLHQQYLDLEEQYIHPSCWSAGMCRYPLLCVGSGDCGKFDKF